MAATGLKSSEPSILTYLIAVLFIVHLIIEVVS